MDEAAAKCDCGRERHVGRPKKYTRELATEICKLLSEGVPLTKICKTEGFPSYRTVLNWLWDDAKEKDEFLPMYVRARDAQADRMVDEIISIADDATGDTVIGEDGKKRVDWENVQRSRLRVEARKWVAAKLKPRKYGDRTSIEFPDAQGNPQQVGLLTDQDRATRLMFLLETAKDRQATKAAELEQTQDAEVGTRPPCDLV